MAKYEITAITIIQAEPADVWAVLDNFRNWPDWMPAMQNLQVELLTPGQIKPGYRFRLRNKLVHADLEVTTCTRLERATRFRLNLPPLTGANQCVLTPLEHGGYRLERKDWINLPGPIATFLNATQRQRLEQLAADFLLSLKRTVEQRGSFAQSAATD